MKNKQKFSISRSKEVLERLSNNENLELSVYSRSVHGCIVCVDDLHWEFHTMKRGYGILITGAGMLVIGRFLSQWIVNSIPTINPSHSSMMADAQYHMLSWSNQLDTISQWGIIVLVIGGFVTVLDRIKKPKGRSLNP